MVNRSQMHLLSLLCFVVVGYQCQQNAESPGFFLKVSKNIPRLGRRSQTLGDFENFFLKTSKSVPRIGRDSKVPNGSPSGNVMHAYYSQFRSPSKREVAHTYNNVQPFDSKSLMNLIADENVNKDDFKFISWKDFDVALESDNGLFERLAALSNLEHNISSLSEKMVHNEFVPLYNARNQDEFYYRVDRSEKNKVANNDPNAEKLRYHN